MLLDAESEKLRQKLLASVPRKLDDAHLDVPRRDAKSCSFVLNRVHLGAEGPTLHFLDGGLLVGDGLNEELAAHGVRFADVIERFHRLDRKRTRLNSSHLRI